MTAKRGFFFMSVSAHSVAQMTIQYIRFLDDLHCTADQLAKPYGGRSHSGLPPGKYRRSGWRKMEGALCGPQSCRIALSAHQR
jgi:hypothetical protein